MNYYIKKIISPGSTAPAVSFSPLQETRQLFASPLGSMKDPLCYEILNHNPSELMFYLKKKLFVNFLVVRISFLHFLHKHMILKCLNIECNFKYLALFMFLRWEISLVFIFEITNANISLNNLLLKQP
jgi:hypothetical protein